MLDYQEYKRVSVMDFPERIWPNGEIMKAPVWCSVDLRDGNQALVESTVVEERVEMLNLPVKLGFKEIEVGFPAASQTEYNFLRALVERKLIPDGVEVQVLVQCREYLIKRTFEALEDVRKAIVYIYNSTFTLQRDVVFHKDREDIKNIVVIGTKMVQQYMVDCDAQIRLGYPPESFTDTGLDFTLGICAAVQETWGATRESPIVISLPSIVEVTTPNAYADQIEWMNTYFKNRESIILGTHPHNDRGEGVAPIELALLARVDRVEGTLFGNGEHIGSVDILIVVYNMFSQGINPELNVENIHEIADVCERCARMDISSRHPYVSKLVFITSSGSHQDTISKGMRALHEGNGQCWGVPYLPIDSSDTGREYKLIVCINSQSGKSDMTFVMGTFCSFKLPKSMYKEFAGVIQRVSEQQGEVAPEQIVEGLKRNYLERRKLMRFRKCHIADTEIGDGEFATLARVTYSDRSIEKTFEGIGNGPIDVAQRDMEGVLGIQIKALSYGEHALASGSGAKAASYIHLVDQVIGKATHGVGVSPNITRASLRGMFSVVNRLFY